MSAWSKLTPEQKEKSRAARQKAGIPTMKERVLALKAGTKRQVSNLEDSDDASDDESGVELLNRRLRITQSAQLKDQSVQADKKPKKRKKLKKE